MKKNQILSRELAKLGAIGGAAGAITTEGMLAKASGALGGACGAWIASQFLPEESYSHQYSMPCDGRNAVIVIVDAVAKLGRLKDSAEIKSPHPTVVATVGSGFMKLNPCVLTVEIITSSEKETTAVICGAAKEGIIKQNTGKKAVLRLIEAIKKEST